MTKVRKRSVEAPKATFDRAPVVYPNVLLGDDEDVEWIWTHTSKGSYVSGYEIKKKAPTKDKT